jgi:hypothetical protein
MMSENRVLREYWYLNETNQKEPGEACVALLNTKLIELANQGGYIDEKSSTPRNMTGPYKILFRKSEGMRLLAIYRHIGEHIIEMKCKEIGIDWIKLAQFRVH